MLPEVPWAGNAGSASKNKEQLRTAVQPLVAEVKAGQSCSLPAPAPSRTPVLPAPLTRVGVFTGKEVEVKKSMITI